MNNNPAMFGAAFLTLILLLASQPIIGQLTTNRDGKLDRTFGTNGLTTFVAEPSIGTYEGGQDLALAPDGKLLTIHSFRSETSGLRTMLSRFSSNGMPDIEFGTNGKLILTDWPSFTAIRVLGQSDGKIVLTGLDRNGIDFMVLRIHENGAPDASFGRTGVVRKDFSLPGGLSNDVPYSINPLPDGKYVLSGISDRFVTDGPTTTYVSVIRLNSNGSVDSTFANGGISIMVGQDQSTHINPFVGTQTFRTDDGKLVVGTIKERLRPGGKGELRTYINILRLLSNGELDPDFSDDGVVDFVEVFPAPLMGIRVLENGKIALATVYEMKSFLPNGSIDTNFSHPPLALQTYNFSVTANGKFLLGGLRFSQDGISGVVRRLYPDGTFDIKFGQYGASQIRLDYDSDTAVLKSILDTSGKLVVLGENNALPTRSLFIARIFTSRKL